MEETIAPDIGATRVKTGNEKQIVPDIAATMAVEHRRQVVWGVQGFEDSYTDGVSAAAALNVVLLAVQTFDVFAFSEAKQRLGQLHAPLSGTDKREQFAWTEVTPELWVDHVLRNFHLYALNGCRLISASAAD